MAKPDPLPTARLRIDRLVDPDEFAAHVDERPAAVAGVDLRVGLEQIRRVLAAMPALGADDALRHAFF